MTFHQHPAVPVSGTAGAAASRGRCVLRPPSPALAPFVASLGYHESGRASARDLRIPSGSMLLAVNLASDEARWYDGANFTGANTRRGAIVVSAGAGPIGTDFAEWPVTVGVAFRPGGANPFFARPASAIDEPVVELEALWGRDGDALRERLLAAPTPQAMLSTLEAVLVERMVRSPEPDPAVAVAVGVLDRGAPVAEVADRVGITDRTLRRRFTEQVGLTPKRFARVRRLHRLLASIVGEPAVDWARAAADCGYFDQTHMVKDFRALTGLTPGAFRPELACPLNHIPLAR